MKIGDAYTDEEIETIRWATKRFDYFLIACLATAFAAKALLANSNLWKLLAIIASPFAIWSYWAVLGVRCNIRVSTPGLAALMRIHTKSQASSERK